MTERAAVSVVVPARDEADRIADFLRAHSWADDIVVVDNGSVDATAELATALGARVLSCPGVTIGEARNRGADAARHDWILALDADEAADGRIAPELIELLSSRPRALAYRLLRRNFVLGREQRHGPFARNWVIRLHHRSVRWTARPVHEALVLSGPVGTLQATLSHTPYRNLDDHLARLDRYARLGAEALHAAGRRASLFDRYLRPAWRFVRAGVFRAGWLDGRTGWTLARLDARSAFLKYRYLDELSRGEGR